LYGDKPEPWDFEGKKKSDIVVVNLGTNDNNTANHVSNAAYQSAYIKLVEDIHRVYPQAQIILMTLWGGFSAVGNTYLPTPAFVDEIQATYDHYRDSGFVHLFDTSGILQHNDIAPQWHPTDVGHIKVASHLMQFIKSKFEGWEFGSMGPEVQHETLYWNDEQNY
jgi:lysophospholipase L1-like esterase